MSRVGPRQGGSDAAPSKPSQPNDSKKPAGKASSGVEQLKAKKEQLGKYIERLAPWWDDMEEVRASIDTNQRLMRDQVYSLSQALGEVTTSLNKQMAVERLQAWMEASSREEREVIERQLAFHGSLLVTDMSGFTRITREEGILHFLMLIKQMQAICLPILQRFGGRLLKVEADDMFVLFPTPVYAVKAAIACLVATNAYSEKMPRKNDKIVLSAGIIDGAMWHIPHLDAFGETVEVGFRLGEDLAEAKSVLVHSSVKEKVEAAGGIPNVSFKKAPPAKVEEHTHECWTVEWVSPSEPDAQSDAAPPTLGERIWRTVRSLLCCAGGAPPVGQGHSAPAAKMLSVINAEVNQEEPLDLITMLDERIECVAKPGDEEEKTEQVALIDARIIARFARKNVTVLVVMLEVKTKGRPGQELRTAGTVIEIKDLAEKLVTAHGGSTVKAMQQRTVPAIFALMPTALSALETAVLLFKLGEEAHRGRVVFQAGLASGEVLDFEGCNTFGDPVNTAFKLGEDLAEPWELCVDPSTTAGFGDVVYCAMPFERKSAKISGVQLSYTSINYADTAGQKAFGKIRIVSSAEAGHGTPDVSVAANPSGCLDWTEVLGKGVEGIKLPYGAGQNRAASHVQAAYRAKMARRFLSKQKSTKHSLKSKVRMVMNVQRVMSVNYKATKQVRNWQEKPWSVAGERLLARVEIFGDMFMRANNLQTVAYQAVTSAVDAHDLEWRQQHRHGDDSGRYRPRKKKGARRPSKKPRRAGSE